MTPLGWLGFWSFAFAATHLSMSHPLRGPMVRTLGPKGFQIVYSLISLVTLVMAARAYAPAQDGAAWLWPIGMTLWAIASFLMWIGSIWFVGAFRVNPALPHPEAKALARQPAAGVFATTRHPMMWGFALWGVVHIMVNPTPASVILSLAIIVTALGGAWGQDRKKRKLMGDAWREWEGRTSFLPFGKGLKPMGSFALVGGTIFFFVATWAHDLFGSSPSGLWIWL